MKADLFIDRQISSDIIKSILIINEANIRRYHAQDKSCAVSGPSAARKGSTARRISFNV